MSFSYEEYISRNYMYIPEKLQNKIKKTKIAFLGSGLNSIIAEHCVRLGITDIFLIDGDKVELSNLNRQEFCYKDIESYKVYALKNKLALINPEIKIHARNTFINSIDDISEEIDYYDIIVNTVDCNQIYFDIVEFARKKNKLVICPFNPGFGGLAILFTDKSASIYEIFNIENNTILNDLEIAKQLFKKYPEIQAPNQANTTIDGFLQTVVSTGYFPQTIVGALQTSSFVLTSIIKYIDKKLITIAPRIFYINCLSF